MKTTVVTARIPQETARRVQLLAKMRGVDRQEIIKRGIEIMLMMAPEARNWDKLLAEAAPAEVAAG